MLPIQRSPSVSRRRLFSLALLCAVQALERFAFLAMLPLFVLYAQDQHAIPAPTALLVLSVFLALSYLGGWPGGWLNDRKIGARWSTLAGVVLLAGGYGVLTLNRAIPLWPALGLMVLGHSLFKPGLLVLIGRVAGGDDQARERAFLWHYLAVNLGHAAGALFGEWAHAHYGWTALFGGATLASALSVLGIGAGMARLRSVASTVQSTAAQASSASAAQGMRAVWLLCIVGVVFWLTAQQASSSLTLFAATSTMQTLAFAGHEFRIGPGHFASLHGLLVLAMLPAFLALHRSRRAQGISTTNKMIWGYVVSAAAFALMAAAGLHGGDLGRVSGAWLVGCYVLLSLAEILLAPLGMSLILRLAPKEKSAQAVGLWFAGCAIGNGLAGALGLFWDRWPHHRYFALLAVLSLGAAAVLRPRRRQLDWLTTFSTSAAAQPGADEARDSTTSTPASFDPLLGQPLMPRESPSPMAFALAGLAILVPGAVAAIWSLPLPVRGVGALIASLAMLLCGSYLLSHAILCWAGHDAPRAR